MGGASMVEALVAATFWACAGVVVYSYLLYPVFIFALSRVFGREAAPPASAVAPRAALLIAAYNESSILEERILNALETEYPEGRYEVVIASDGSDDGTAAVCARHGDRIRAFLFPQRRGKAATLAEAVSRIDAEVIILSDANTFMDPGAAAVLTRWFEDPGVGAVCGRLVLTDPACGRNADGLYWRYEGFLKSCEARLGALLGANGAIYAIRRELLTQIPADAIVDDFVIPLSARIRTGLRIVYEPRAVAREETAPDLRGEFGRRVRIGVGGWQSLGLLWPLLGPRYGWTALAFWSHKVMRWACPFMLIGALASALALARHPLYATVAGVQLVFHAVCIVAAVAPPIPGAARVMRLCGMFFAMNLALLVGFARWVRGGHTGIWRRTARA